MKKILIFLFSISAAAQVTLTPGTGSYTGPVTVTVNCPAGQNCFYTTDGSKPSIAGFLYTAPLVINATATLRVIAVQTGVMTRNANTSISGWECVTTAAQNYSLGCTDPAKCCKAGGGVGANPNAVSWSFGQPMVQSMSANVTTSSTQMLFTQGKSYTCPNCTEMVEDKVFIVDHDKTALENNELDFNVNVPAQGLWHTASLQCNQQAGKLRWQVDNQQGSWVSTNITYGCPNSTTQQTEIRYGIHWNNSDTSCTVVHGTPPVTYHVSCDYYDFLTVCVGGSQGQGGVCKDFAPIEDTTNTPIILAADIAKPSWAVVQTIQDQPDTVPSAAPVTVVRKVWNDNGTTAMYGTETTAQATYTIGAPPTATPFTIGGDWEQLGGTKLVIH